MRRRTDTPARPMALAVVTLAVAAAALLLPHRAAAAGAGAPAVLAAPLPAQEDAPPDTAPPAAGDTLPAREEAPAAARAPVGGFLSAYALMSFDPRSEEIGIVAASSRFSAGSGLVFLERGVGAAAVLGRLAPGVGAAILGRLAEGFAPQQAVETVLQEAATAGGLQVGALTPECERHADTGEGASPWSGSRSGEIGSVCYLAVGSLLGDEELLARMEQGFRQAEGSLTERLLAALEAAEEETGEVGRSRSAALWVTGPEGEEAELGRAVLRLQVEDVQRPAAALARVLETGRADRLAMRANASVDAGAYEEALQRAEDAIGLEASSAEAWLARGRALLFLEREDEAEEALRRMLEINPYLLPLLEDPGGDGDREGAIPFRPRLLERLDTYRRAFFPDIDFSNG